jgi:hypothetical protein
VVIIIIIKLKSFMKNYCAVGLLVSVPALALAQAGRLMLAACWNIVQRCAGRLNAVILALIALSVSFRVG